MDSQRPAFQKIVPSQAKPPATERESAERALFFATINGMESTRLLREYMNVCEQEFHANEANKNVPLPEVTQEEFAEAVKELLCFSIWLALYEHAEAQADPPEWFKIFILQSIGLSDKLYAIPSATEVGDKYPLSEGVEMACQLLSMNMAHKLKLGATAPAASLHLASLVQNNERVRAELMSLSLTETIESLDNIIHESSGMPS